MDDSMMMVMDEEPVGWDCRFYKNAAIGVRVIKNSRSGKAGAASLVSLEKVQQW